MEQSKISDSKKEIDLKDELNVLDMFSTTENVLEIADQDDHWHFVTCGVVVGSGHC